MRNTAAWLLSAISPGKSLQGAAAPSGIRPRVGQRGGRMVGSPLFNVKSQWKIHLQHVNLYIHGVSCMYNMLSYIYNVSRMHSMSSYIYCVSCMGSMPNEHTMPSM